MKKFIFLLSASLLVFVLIGIALFLMQPGTADDNSVHIELYSDPFPMRVGQMELLVSLTDSAGNPVDDATVSSTTQIMTDGNPEINDPARRYENDRYVIPIIWTMVGQASVMIHAELPDGRTYSEQFIVFVYMIPPDVEEQAFLPEREVQAYLEESPDNEYRVVVPHGAQEITASTFTEFIPELVELSVSGQNTLVIRNDDFVANQVGPFYIAAGETLRQRFDAPGVFQGTCTINQGVIRIEVDA